MSDIYDEICYLIRRVSELFKEIKETPPEDIESLFYEQSESGTKLSEDELLEFLVRRQGEDEASASVIAKKVVAKSYKRSGTFSKKGCRVDDFFHFLLGKMNLPLIEQEDELNDPLPHYFVHASHSSYFQKYKSIRDHMISFTTSDLASTNTVANSTSKEEEEDYKLSGRVSAVLKALKRGIRVIELNLCRNSNNTDVKVKNEGYFHSSVKLSTCLKAIAEHAFDKSELPVILILMEDIDDHLKDVAAAKIEKYLGDRVYSSDDVFSVPLHRLLSKFVILSRQMKHRHNTPNSSGTESSEKYRNLIAGHVEDLEDQFQILQDGEAVNARLLSSTESVLENVRCADIIRFTQNNLLAVYQDPGHTNEEIESSRYDPFLGWLRGAQIVAFDTHPTQKLDKYLSDKCLWIMQGLFRAYKTKHGTGYARKPDILIKQLKFDPNVWRPIKRILKVKVYMGTGWHLDFSGDDFDKTSRPDFFVDLEIVGHPEDEAKEKTVPAIDQWIPTWNEEFEFTLTVPDIAMLMIEVKEFDSNRTHDFGGQTCLPVSLLKDGIRSVPLYKQNGKPCKAARLLIRFQQEILSTEPN